MNTLEDLRRTLESHAAAAPGAFGLAERAQTRALGLRRRRRIFGGTATALAIALVAAGVPVFLRGPAVAPPPASPPDRSAAQVSLGVDASSPFLVTMLGGDEDSQFATLRARPGGTLRSGVDVQAYDPGTFDPAALRRGEPVTVGGRPAWYVTELPNAVIMPLGRPGLPGPAVGWERDDGVWVIVGDLTAEADTRDRLIEVAEAVRLTAPEAAVAPFRFGWLPDGLAVTRTEQHLTGPQHSATFTFGDLRVRAVPAAGDPDWAALQADMRDLRVVDGLPTRYLPQPNAVWSGPPTGADMAVDAGSCRIYLTVRDRAVITRADLERIVTEATFGDCADLTTWRPPVG